MTKGKFIVLEGQGFSGKTEQARLLVDKLEKLGIEVIETQEPGGVEKALLIREELLKRRAEHSISPEEELELFYKAREYFLEELVRPALKNGKWIVSTRFSATTFVYQGYEGGISLELIETLDERIVKATQPDLYILLDVDPKEIIKRMDESLRQKHGYNEMDPKIIENRHKYYLQIAKENKHNNWEIIGGNEEIDEVAEKIWAAVKEKFEL